MSFTPPAAGTPNWDVPLNVILARIGTSIWSPNDHNMISYTTQPSSLGSSATPTSGAVRLSRIRLMQPATITNMNVIVGIAGSGLVAGQSFIGLYTTSGTLLSATADMSTDFATTGVKTKALTTPQSLAAGDYFCAIVTNGTTTPSIVQEAGALSVAAVNVGLTAGSNARFMGGPTGQTSLPASINMATDVTLGTNTYWFGLS
jgi:hypothetical protein